MASTWNAPSMASGISQWPWGTPAQHREHLARPRRRCHPPPIPMSWTGIPPWWRVIFVAWYGEGAVKPWPLKVPLKNLKSRVEPTVLPFWPKLICVKLAKSTEMGQHIFFLILLQVHVPSFSPWVFKTFSTTGQDEEGRKIFPWPKSFAEIVRGPTETCDVQG